MAPILAKSTTQATGDIFPTEGIAVPLLEV